jgi:hypothetical protein
VLNIEGNLVQLSGAQTIDLDPATAIPPSVTWLELSRLSMRVPPGAFPIGTPFKRHTVDWFAVYGDPVGVQDRHRSEPHVAQLHREQLLR